MKRERLGVIDFISLQARDLALRRPQRGGCELCCCSCKMRMRAPSSLQKIRLSSDWANPLNGSRN